MKLRSLLLPVDDLDVAVNLLVGQLGCTVKFRDGNRFCELVSEGCSLALLGREERVVEAPTLSILVEDLPAATKSLVECGAIVLKGPDAGPHEVRTIIRAPGGVPLALYAKKSSSALT